MEIIPRSSGGGFNVLFESDNQETAKMIKTLAVSLLVEMGYQQALIFVSDIQKRDDYLFFGISSSERRIKITDLHIALAEAAEIIFPAVKNKER